MIHVRILCCGQVLGVSSPAKPTGYSDRDAAYALHPPPAGTLHNETANYGSKYGTQERGDTVERCGETPLGNREEISNGATCIDQR